MKSIRAKMLLRFGVPAAREQCGDLLKDVMGFQEENQHDDITITVFQRLE